MEKLPIIECWYVCGNTKGERKKEKKKEYGISTML
jgi:hypothetical protein